MLMVLLLVLIVVRSGVHHTFGGGYGRKKNNVEKDDLKGTDDGLRIKIKNWFRKIIDEVEEDDDETIAILTEN